MHRLMDFVYDLDGPELLAALRDHGRRRHRRFVPPGDAPLRVALRGQTGWRVEWREVDDISLGGLGLKLSSRDAKVIRIGEECAIQMQIPSGLIVLAGRAAHLSRTRVGWRSVHHLGMILHTEKVPPWTRQQFIDYLLSLAALVDQAA